MTYNDVADMQASESLQRRITAAVAQEQILDPEAWLFPRHWQVVTQPGWDAAWASAVAGGVEDPGHDAGVITDGMILSGVQAVIQSELPPPEPEPEPTPVVVTPGTPQSVTHDDPMVVADPLTPWTPADAAVFIDGPFYWDGAIWVAVA